ncbi:hypothetical protein DEJ49_33540 [Streptomyces venezuelae]|uniref:Phage gp6-like head-tail connector protein n=1 Tax=Streptomyces venezuelae TaxID=54571 RepID=A0A5P2CQT1_STRVZ|nr:hypothetical protein [Streptomyces venezuelae]QES45264.1 hypothetical protein DEJ49_33540 [Streptomyces venezuelae]
MALGDAYATVPELKVRLPNLDEVATYDDVLEEALSSVSREIEQFCGRQFNKADAATVREYGPDEIYRLREGSTVTQWVRVDDFYDVTDLVIEVDGAAWTPADYVLHPRNGVVDGMPGWPYYEIHAAGSLSFGTEVSVTAKWGWSAVPAPVKQACLIMAAETFQIKDAPFGVAGSDAFGAIRVRDNRMAMTKLSRYCRDPIRVR